MRKTILILILLFTALYSVPSTFAESGLQVTITATISNISEIKQYISKDTTLQLVKVDKDGKLSGGSDAQGRIYYKSDLAKIAFPKGPRFSIKANNLGPGKYLIAAQLLNSMNVNPLLMKGDAFAIIEIPEGSNSPRTVDLGQVSFQIK